MKRSTRKAPGARMGARARGLVNFAGIGLWGSGVMWLGLHYFAVRAGEFGPERSPLEPWGLRIHGAFAFLALWTGGFLWARHVVSGWRTRRRRWTGISLLGALLALILSGHLLYYAGDDQARQAISLAHWILGLALPAAYLAHRHSRPLRPRG
jgi:hypothetical protein